MTEPDRESKMKGRAGLSEIRLDPATEAAKAEPHNVRAELSQNLFESKPQNISAKSLELQIFQFTFFNLP